MGATLVERMRDSVPGKNTLIKLGELHDAGIENIVVLRPGEPFVNFSDYESGLSKGEFDYVYIDTKWAERFTLGDKSAVGTLRKVWLRASELRLKKVKESWEEEEREREKEKEESLPHDERIRVLSERLARERRFEAEARKREAEYTFLNPVALLKRLQEAKLVVAPRHLLPKLASEGGLTNLAELVDAETGNTLPYAQQTSPDYPRVFVASYKPMQRGEPDRVSRIDGETISLLFRPSDERDHSMFGIMSELLGSRLDARFLGVLKGKTYISPVPRTTFEPPPSQREKKARELFVGLFDRAFGGDEDSDESESSGSRGIPSNYYGLGSKPNGFRFASNKFEANLVKGKRHDVLELYESLWLTPLETVQEIHERQQFLEAIVSNDEQAAAFSNLERGINSMVMPFLHLSNMASNISANILHSRWGSSIRKNDFYNDFVRIAKLFTDAYERYAKGFQAYAPQARELIVLLGAAASPANSDNPLSKTYTFLQKALEARPKDFKALEEIFAAELKSLGAKLLPELEDYDHSKDSDVDLSKLPKKSGGKSLDGYRSPTLERLLKQFHSQNPVTQGQDEINYLDRLGTKLAAYEAIAAFIGQSGWVRPEVVQTKKPVITIRNGWYPLTPVLGETLVRNNTSLGGRYSIEILDGINAGGKTIDMKKTFFIVVLALSGMYVPAESARISMFDRVRFMLKDSGQGDRSALMKELQDINYGLQAVGKQLLMGVDETFTSTNPLEGEAMTAGLVKHVSTQPNVLGIFSSHYPGLHELPSFVNGVRFAHFPFKEENGGIQFPHKKKSGPNRSGDYAIPIARSQNLHSEVVRIAEQYQNRQLAGEKK